MSRKLSDLHAKVYSPTTTTTERLENHQQILTNLTRRISDLSGLVSNQNTRILEVTNDLASLKNPAERSRVSTPPARIEVVILKLV